MRVLLTTSRLDSFGGSELVILEIAEWFLDRGWEVSILCESVGELVRAEWTGHLDIGSLKIVTSEDSGLQHVQFDLVWITHNVWPKALVSTTEFLGPKPKVVTLHMGSLESRESTVFSEIENILADRVLAVSGRTKERMVELGLALEKIALFDNPVPDHFLAYSPLEQATRLQSVLFISNHLPEELLEASSQLRQAGLHITHLGIGGEKQERVGPELLSNHDAVVTIGKSTQYCLVKGIPVYSYDHFGGAGWLSEQIFDFESFNNFSGYRTGRKLSAIEIASELSDGFVSAQQWGLQNKAKFSRHYSLTRQLESLLSSLDLKSTEA